MYGELILGLNMAFNFTILSFANKIQNIRISVRRLCLASFVGALPVVIFSVSIWTIVIPFLGMTFIAYGRSFTPWRKFSTIVLFGALFAGGLLTALQNQLKNSMSYQAVFFSSVIAYFALSLVKNKWIDVRTVKKISELTKSSTLTLLEQEITITAFVDSGNSCVEPLSGNAVHFVSFQAVESYLPADLKAFLLNWNPKTFSTIIEMPPVYQKELRLVKIFTVQGESWAIGIKYKKWAIKGGGFLDPGYIVLTKDDQRYPEGAQAILHVSAMEKLQSERGAKHVQ